MSKIIAIMQNKGGTLKTTVTTNLAGTLSLQEKNNVLILDLDPQSNVATTFGITNSEIKNTIYTYFSGNCTLEDTIIHNRTLRISIIPSEFVLGGIELEIATKKIKTNPLISLKKDLIRLSKIYTHILIDTAPYMNVLSLIAMKIADEIVIPMQLETSCVKGLVNMMKLLKENAPNSKITIIPTLFDSRSKLHNKLLEEIKEFAKKQNLHMTNTKVSKSVKHANATEFKSIPLTLIRGNPKQKIQYHSLAFELGYKQHKPKGNK